MNVGRMIVQLAAIVGFGCLLLMFVGQLAHVIRAEYRQARDRGSRS